MGPPRAPPPVFEGRKPSTLDQIQALERERELRRVTAAERKADKAAEEKRNAAAGTFRFVAIVAQYENM
jgi:hypothetical protein